MEQPRAESVFDVTELMAQRGLRQMQRGSGACEVAVFGHGRHESQMADFEVHAFVLSAAWTRATS
jgi:hypothetical protein